ncbi:hypothetical protein LWI29_016822 [Acer saccharum]|uniref:CASP-like protein n=1 Tax=Acer saccharum TaxID=4024 RepID=A0AA39VDP9_ACESA|nr:hypothetical protein LWI29_016822 [Acer saccharum]KAK1553103.1 hypothetical protein Q3G72_028894 [Acer saccharum]
MKTNNPVDEVDHHLRHDHHEASSGDIIATPRKQSVITRVISILDLIMRIMGAIGTLASAVTMGTTYQTLPFTIQFNLVRAQYDDLPAFTFFVIANSVVCGYLVLVSLPFSIFHVIKSEAKISRIILLIFDTVMLGLLTAGASSAAAIVYLAHEGNSSANWSAICQQFYSFCERISGSLIGSFVTVIMLMLTIITSAIAISRP